LTFKRKEKENMKDITWAPAVALHINHKYKQEYNLIYNRLLDPIITPPSYNNKKTNYNFDLSLSRNSNKSLLTTIFSYDPTFNIFQHKLEYFYKFQKRKSSKLSTTIGIGHHYLSHNKTYLADGITYTITDDSNMEPYTDNFRYAVPEKLERIKLSISERIGAFHIQVQSQYIIWEREYTFSNNYGIRELSNVYYTNNMKGILAYNRKKFTAYVIYRYGFLKTIKYGTD